MGRPPHEVGTTGNVRTYSTSSGWRARTTYRGYDGVTREIQRHGKTETQAKRKLSTAIRDRVFVGGGEDLRPDSKVSLVAEAWHSAMVSEDLAARTLEQYRYNLDRCLIPGLGALRIREVTVATADRYIRAIEKKHGSATAKMSRSVLSGICGFAARRDLLDRNPVRDAGTISTKSKNPPRALTIEQARELRMWLGYDNKAIGRDLPDFVDFMLASGLRIGECAAILWQNIDSTRGPRRSTATSSA